jgi:hypothetical protein
LETFNIQSYSRSLLTDSFQGQSLSQCRFSRPLHSYDNCIKFLLIKLGQYLSQKSSHYKINKHKKILRIYGLEKFLHGLKSQINLKNGPWQLTLLIFLDILDYLLYSLCLLFTLLEHSLPFLDQ